MQDSDVDCIKTPCVCSDQVKFNSPQNVTLVILKPTNCGILQHFYGLFVGYFCDILYEILLYFFITH